MTTDDLHAIAIILQEALARALKSQPAALLRVRGWLEDVINAEVNGILARVAVSDDLRHVGIIGSPTYSKGAVICNARLSDIIKERVTIEQWSAEICPAPPK